MVSSETEAWILTQLEAQKKFVHSVAFITLGILIRIAGKLSPDDSGAVSTITFHIFFPALVSVNIHKAELRVELWRVAVASFCTSAILVLVVLVAARCVRKQDGFRGQWIFCMLGNNIGYTYPLVLSVKGMADTVFPALIVWDVAGNAWVVLLINFLVAITYSPAPPQVAEESITVMAQESRSQELTSAQRRGSAASSDASFHSTLPSLVGSAAMPAPEIEEASMAEAASKAPSTALRLLRGLRSNVGLISTLVAITMNFSGVRLPAYADEIVETLGQPFNVLFFFLVGLHLRWRVVRPHLRSVALIVACRLLTSVLLGALLWVLPILPDRFSRQAMLFAMCCPVSGMSMSYAMDFGYNRSMQAALTATTNVISLALLWCALNLT